MANITFHTISNASYLLLVSSLIKLTEVLSPTVKNIGDQRATIGYGYTFNRNNNVAIWTTAGISLTTTQWALLAQIDSAPASQKTSLALQFNLTMTAPQANALLIASIPSYEGPANSLNMPQSLERAAFVSITYNRGVGAVNSKMGAFFSAINSGDQVQGQVRQPNI